MIVVERQGIEVDFCISCRGLWFDGGEIALLGESLGREIDPLALGEPLQRPVRERARKCPRCDVRMSKVELEAKRPTLADRCPREHGLWLDSGELAAFLESRPSRSDTADEPVRQFLGELIGPGSPVS